MELRYNLSPAEREKEFKLSNRSQLEVIGTVYEGLDAYRRRLLKGGCFKHLFSMPKLKVSGTIIHQLIMRLSNTISEEDCWFIIGGQSLRFGITEFAVITGLKIGNVDMSIDESVGINSPLVQKYFKGKKTVRRKDVMQAFTKCKNREDKYKLGLILILAYVVISLDDVKGISLWWFDLVDDLKSFNNYPWGNLSYKMTTEVLRRDLSVPFNTEKVAYVVHGFPLSIMVWAFESISSISEYATRLDGEKFPRMINWKLSRQRFQSSEIEQALENEEVVLISELVITEAERACIFGDAGTEKKEPEEKVGNKILTILHQLEGEIDAFIETASTGEKTEFVKMLHRLERKIEVDVVLSGSEDNNGNGIEESNTFEDDAEFEECNVLDKVEAEKEEPNVLVKSGEERKKRGKRKLENVEVKEVKSGEERKKRGKRKLENVEVKEVKSGEEKKKRGKRKLENVEVKEVKRVEREERTKRGKRRKVAEYDPLMEIDNAKIEYLDKWLMTDALERHEVSVLHDRVLNSDELMNLLTTGWISSSIMETSLDLLRERMREQSKRFQIGACVMDPWFPGYVKRSYMKLTSCKPSEKVSLPGILGVQSWREARHIYFTVCSDSSKHWFACNVDVTEQCIYIYDSLPKHIRKAEFDQIMKPFLEIIPLIYSNVSGGVKLTLKVQKVSGLAVQDNGNDCGLYALKFIEFLVAKQDLGRLKSIDMNQIRKNLVAELVSMTKD